MGKANGTVHPGNQKSESLEDLKKLPLEKRQSKTKQRESKNRMVYCVPAPEVLVSQLQYLWGSNRNPKHFSGTHALHRFGNDVGQWERRSQKSIELLPFFNHWLQIILTYFPPWVCLYWQVTYQWSQVSALIQKGVQSRENGKNCMKNRDNYERKLLLLQHGQLRFQRIS